MRPSPVHRLAAITFALLVLASCRSFPETSARSSRIDRLHNDYLDHSENARVMVVAHRGLWRNAPENSLAAIEAAIEAGADIIEVDVQRTSDGQLVLMHDRTVDRMTEGVGDVASLSLAEVTSLRLRAGRGGPSAPLTDHRTPSLEQALAAIKGRAMINLDRAWPFREEAYALLTRLGMLDFAIFKSSAPPAEVLSFLGRDPRILYSHVINDSNASDVRGWTGASPQSFEIVFDREDDVQARPEVIALIKRTSRLWVNTMWDGLAAQYTDEQSLISPADGWGNVIRLGANIIQTDQPEALVRWLREGRPVTRRPASAKRQAIEAVPRANAKRADSFCR